MMAKDKAPDIETRDVEIGSGSTSRRMDACYATIGILAQEHTGTAGCRRGD